MLDKLKQKMAEQKQKVGRLTLDLIPNRVSPEIQQERIDICNSCEKLYKPTYTCKACGCFMNVKTWMGGVSCPLKKWTAVNLDE